MERIMPVQLIWVTAVNWGGGHCARKTPNKGEEVRGAQRSAMGEGRGEIAGE